MSEKVLLFSGGMDSFIAWHFLKKPKAVYFHIGLDICDRELEVIKELGVPVIVDKSIDLSTREIDSDTKFLPMRNLYFAMLACKYGDEIYMAGLKDDKVNDKNEEIFAEFSGMLSNLNERRIKVLSPFWNYTKADVVRWYLATVGNEGKALDQLIRTGSCYDLSTGYCCYKCRCCFRKWVALWVNGIKLDFYNRNLLDEYYERAKQRIYVRQRNENIIRAVEEYLKIEKRKVYFVDIDGVLTNEVEGHDYFSRTPNLRNIAKVNELHERGNKIVLWSSRFPEDEEATRDWLIVNCVKFDELRLGKPQYDAIIDDKTIDLNGII